MILHFNKNKTSQVWKVSSHQKASKVFNTFKKNRELGLLLIVLKKLWLNLQKNLLNMFVHLNLLVLYVLQKQVAAIYRSVDSVRSKTFRS